MSRPATTLSARLRARTISLSMTPAQRPFSLNVDAAKARVAHWEPTFPFDALRSDEEQNDSDGDGDNQDGSEDIQNCTTYSAFDPRASRPLLLLHSGVDISVRPPTSTTAVIPRAVKPWPYSLPVYLRPGVGTTFAIMHTTLESARLPETEKDMKKKEKLPAQIGILQAVLYGVPDPEEFSYAQAVVKDGGVLHRVLYGVKDPQKGGEHGGLVGRVEAVKASEDAAAAAVLVIREVKVDLEDNIVEVKGSEIVAK
ncbi:uncharacterized protein K460DRAFT_358975 [Cucurbitaria berberidis CBS 394.84]|uniref:Uncharacterized protein n=1 Tax=Cucurbitaria berberidis CBS 394.84 TaxID=1168544 RepID=A0A9P4GB79_9PLEO|nr:uncharacterized protein K460DRAFT_358975 [Cucurbitaria berberidis CBS 394.84]KAF1842356.1 hypothetical protein K460DRAFT_358975 [Cucurbitaria berberidis CBS 394.84]